MQIVFPYDTERADILGQIKRPTADVSFWSEKIKLWMPIKMVVDTGADYTLLPSWMAHKLGINLHKDCQEFATNGIGGSQKSYIVKGGWKVKFGRWEDKVTLGFITSHSVPPPPWSP